MSQGNGWNPPPEDDAQGNRIFTLACVVGGTLLGGFLISFGPYILILKSRTYSRDSIQWMVADTTDAFLLRLAIGSTIGGVAGFYYARKIISRK